MFGINCLLVAFNTSDMFKYHTEISAAYLDGDDELRDDRQNLAASGLEHVLNTLHCQEAVRIVGLPDAIEEDGQVMVIVQLLYVNLKRCMKRCKVRVANFVVVRKPL